MTKKIPAETLNKWLSNDKDNVVLIDVREAFEHQNESIDDDIHIPLNQLCEAKLNDFSNRKIIFYCASGNRSLKACKKMDKKTDGLDLYTLDGGIQSWKNKGYFLQKSEKAQMPLNQQVQLVIGIFLLIGCMLTFFINTLFVIIPFLLGCGLIFAGLSGTCGMALFIAKMPWNRIGDE
tara:strand:- start:101 stop:634 length:534 start_codon:yes stop_codon:yes gene_type:complete